MMKIHSRFIGAGALVIGLVLTGCQNSATSESVADEPLCGDAPPVESSLLRVGNAGGTTTEPYVLFGIEEGCFAKHGLEVESIPGSSTVGRVAALEGGSMDVTIETPTEILLAMANSSLRLVVVADFIAYDDGDIVDALAPGVYDGTPVLDTAFLVREDVPFENLEDLSGLRIGIASMGDPSQLGLERAFRSAGGDPSQYELIALPARERLEAFQRGEVDAAILSLSFIDQGVAQGGRVVLYPGAYWIQAGPSFTWFTTEEIVSEKEDELLAFRKAMDEIRALVRNPANQARFKDFLVNDYGLAPEVVEGFDFPSFSDRKTRSEDFEYLVPQMIEEGLIAEAVKPPEVLGQ